MPNGGIDKAGNWVKPKRPDGEKFLFPVKAVSQVFRGKLLGEIEKLYRKKKLSFPDPQSECDFRNQLNLAGSKNWNVYAKPPFAGPMQVIKYLSRYTHRIAISPKRILEVTDKTVTFSYKDYRDDAKKKISTMDGHLFVKRFLLHVLPARFRKIRHYGWARGEVMNRYRDQLLTWFRRQKEFAAILGKLLIDLDADPAGEKKLCRCRNCKDGFLEFVRVLPAMLTKGQAEYG